MRRFLFVALAAGLLSPTAAMAEPVPGISDLDADPKYPVRIGFFCPRTKVRVRNDRGQYETESRKLYKNCWVEFHSDYINVMDRQTIKRKDVLRYWLGEAEAGLCCARWNLLYRTKAGKRHILQISQKANVIYPSRVGETETPLINKWMAQ